MTSYKNLACFLSTILLLSLPMFGQYVGTGNPDIYDGLTNCATVNCWNRLSTNTGFTFITASDDGVVVGGYPGKVYEWSNATEGWLEVSGWETVPNGSQIQRMRFSQQPSTATGVPYAVGLTNEASNNVYELVFNGTRTAWQSLPGNGDCTTDVGIGHNGDIWCLAGAYEGSHSIFHWSSGMWTQASGALSNLSVNGSDIFTFVCGVNSANQLFVRSKSGAWNQITGLGFTPSAAVGAVSCGEVESPDGANGAPIEAITSMDTSNGIHMSHDGGATWHTIYGTASVVSGPLASETIVLGAGVPFHYTGMMPAITQTTSGTYGCPGCNGSQVNHTATANAFFPHGLAGGQQQEVALWSTNFNVTSLKDYEPGCDPIFTFGNPECNVALTSTVACPIAGYLPVTYVDQEPMENGLTEQKYLYLVSTGKTIEYGEWGLVYKQGVAVQWCNPSAYPVMNYLWVDDDDPASYYNTTTWWRGWPGNWTAIASINWGTSNQNKASWCTSLARVQ
jgi:hypothetical protein